MDNAGKKISELINSIGSGDLKEKFDDFIKFSLESIERNRGEHVYFENNPADPTLPRVMRDVNTARLEEFIWLSYAMKYSSKIRRLTKEEVEKIISKAVPTSKRWSETHKQIISTTIVCPCCNAISMIVKVSCQGQPSGASEESVDGLYKVIVDISETEVRVNTYKLEETLLEESVLKI